MGLAVHRQPRAHSQVLKIQPPQQLLFRARHSPGLSKKATSGLPPHQTSKASIKELHGRVPTVWSRCDVGINSRTTQTTLKNVSTPATKLDLGVKARSRWAG